MSIKKFTARKSYFSKRIASLEILESRELLSVSPLGDLSASYAEYASVVPTSGSAMQTESAAPMVHSVWMEGDFPRGEVDTIALNLVFDQKNESGADIVYEIWYSKSGEGQYATWFDTGVRVTLAAGRSATTDETALKVDVDVSLLTQGSGEYAYFSVPEAGLGRSNMIDMDEYVYLDTGNGVQLPPPGRFAGTMPAGAITADYSPYGTMTEGPMEITVNIPKAFTGLNPSLYYHMVAEIDGSEYWSEEFRSLDSTIVIDGLMETGTCTLYLYASSLSGVFNFTESISKTTISVQKTPIPDNCPAVKSVTAQNSDKVGWIALDVQFASKNTTGADILYEIWYTRGASDMDLSAPWTTQCSTTLRLQNGQSTAQVEIEYWDFTDTRPGNFAFFYVAEPVATSRSTITPNTSLVSAPFAAPQGGFFWEDNIEDGKGVLGLPAMEGPGKIEIVVRDSFSGLTQGAYYRVDAVPHKTGTVAGSSAPLLYNHSNYDQKMTIDNLTVEGYYTLYLYACDAQGTNIYSRPLSSVDVTFGDPRGQYPDATIGVEDFQPGKVDKVTVNVDFSDPNKTGADVVYEIWYTKSNESSPDLAGETWFDSGVRVTMKAGQSASIVSLDIALSRFTEGLGDTVTLHAMKPGQGQADMSKDEYAPLSTNGSFRIPPAGRFKSNTGITAELDPEGDETGPWLMTIDVDQTFSELDPNLYYYVNLEKDDGGFSQRSAPFRGVDQTLVIEQISEQGVYTLELIACDFEGHLIFSVPISTIGVNVGAVPGEVDLTGGATVTGLTTGGATLTLPKTSGAKSYKLYINGTEYAASSKNTFILTDLNSCTQYEVSYSTDKDATIKSVGSFTTLNGGTASNVTVGVPTAVKFAAVKNGSSKITWKAPANYTGGYNVIVTVDGSGTVYEIAPGAKTEYTLTGIDANKVYEIVVVADAVNAVESTPVYINKTNTPAWTGGDLPTTGSWPAGGKVTVIKPSLAMVGGHLQANWGVSIPPPGTNVISRIVLKDSGGSILDAVYVYNNVNNETWTFDNITLTPGAKYTVEVYAVHLAANFTEDYTSKAGSGTITVPAYPVATAKVSNISLGGATVTVTPGKNAPTDSYYYVEYTNVVDAKGKPDWKSASVVALTGGNLSTTLSGLKQGSQYSTRVVVADKPDGQWSSVAKVATGKDVKFKTVAAPLATISKPALTLAFNPQTNSFDLAMNLLVKNPDMSKLKNVSIANPSFTYQLVCSQNSQTDKSTGLLVGASEPIGIELSDANSKGERSLKNAISLTGTDGIFNMLGLDASNLAGFKTLNVQLVVSYFDGGNTTTEPYATSYSKAAKLTLPKWFS